VNLRLLAVGTVLFWSSFVFGARPASVVQDNTEVYERPDNGSTVVDVLAKQEPVDASNSPTNGFYKVRTKTGVLGWVTSEALGLKESEPVVEKPPQAVTPEKPQKMENSPKSKYAHFQARALGDINFFTAAGVITNFDNVTLGYSFGGEIGYRFTRALALMIRVEQIFKNLSLTDSTSTTNFTVNLGSLPVMGGLDLQLVRSPKFSLHLGAFAGMAFATQLQSTNMTNSTSSDYIATVSTQSITALGKLEVGWHFSQVFSLFLEGGYRYLQTSTLTAPTSNNGALILQSSFILNFSGPIAGGGLSISF